MSKYIPLFIADDTTRKEMGEGHATPQTPQKSGAKDEIENSSMQVFEEMMFARACVERHCLILSGHHTP